MGSLIVHHHQGEVAIPINGDGKAISERLDRSRYISGWMDSGSRGMFYFSHYLLRGLIDMPRGRVAEMIG